MIWSHLLSYVVLCLLFSSLSCSQFCRCLWIVHFWLHLRVSLTFIYHCHAPFTLFLFCFFDMWCALFILVLFCLNMYTLVVFLSFYPCSAPLALFVVVCSFLPLVRSVHIVFYLWCALFILFFTFGALCSYCFLPLVRSVHIVFCFTFALFCFCGCFYLTFVVLRSYCWCSLTFYYIDIVCVFVSLPWTCSVHIVLYFRLDSWLSIKTILLI